MANIFKANSGAKATESDETVERSTLRARISGALRNRGEEGSVSLPGKRGDAHDADSAERKSRWARFVDTFFVREGDVTKLHRDLPKHLIGAAVALALSIGLGLPHLFTIHEHEKAHKPSEIHAKAPAGANMHRHEMRHGNN